MNAEDDKQDELQKMLALKRHETPPPRFFKGFSDQVIDRLHSPEPTGPQTFWQRLGIDLESKPVLVCGSGVLVCGLLVVGLIASLRVEPPKPAPRAAGDQSPLIMSPQSAALAVPTTQIAPVPSVQIGEPVMISEPSPLTQIKLTPQRAALQNPGGTPAPENK